MRLRRLEVENFKGIGKRQTIELKPITLLFGSNSADLPAFFGPSIAREMPRSGWLMFSST
jgi:hypothetical protein